MLRPKDAMPSWISHDFLQLYFFDFFTKYPKICENYDLRAKVRGSHKIKADNAKAFDIQ